MKLAPLEIRRPETIEQALLELASLGSDARILAGGQSLIPLLRYRMATPYVLVDINGLTALDVLETSDKIRVGALVRHSSVEKLACRSQPQSPTALSLMAEHAAEIGFWPVRTRGTVVGSIVHADPQADWLLLLLALDGYITLASKRGLRTVPIREFVVGPLQVNRDVDELAIELTISATRARPSRYGRHKLMRRTGDFAMASSVVLRYDEGWECWASLANDVPCLLPQAGSWLDVHEDTFELEPFIRYVTDEIVQLFPDVDTTMAALHAANVGDAVSDALRPSHSEGND